MAGLSAGEAVLGLLVERPGNCSELERRLEQRFGTALFAHGSAHQAVKRLCAQGLIRAVKGGGARPSASKAVDERRSPEYEATPAGVERFERWLSASDGPPAVREGLQAKIAFCGPEDLPRMLELVSEAELACVAQLEHLTERRRRERRVAGENEWARLMGLVVATGDVVWWDARLRWLQMLRQCLEKEARRFGARGASHR